MTEMIAVERVEALFRAKIIDIARERDNAPPHPVQVGKYNFAIKILQETLDDFRRLK